MINEKSLAAVGRSSFDKEFCKPLYDSYCFSKIPATIKSLLTGGSSDRLPLDVTGGFCQDNEFLVLLFIDGFGWKFFEKYAHKYPFLKRFIDDGVASKITSQFPSTTAPHVTCINTSLDVGQSGIYEWFYYEPKLDRVITPLLFSFAGDKELNTLQTSGIRPEELYPTKTLYQDLNHQGVTSYVMQHELIAHSPYSQIMFQGANNVPYSDIDNALKHILDISSKKRSGKSYFYLYIGDIDSMGHRHGIDSPQFEQAVEHCFEALEKKFWQPLAAQNRKGCCIVIADHGMVSVNPDTTVYLNKEMPALLNLFKKNSQGNIIAPAGSCRDFFLHIQDDRLLEAQDILKTYFNGAASIYLTSDLVEMGFFGTKTPSELFFSRVGNLVILPYKDQAIWWYEKGRFEQHFYGAHGGLTRDEMETIFLFNEIH